MCLHQSKMNFLSVLTTRSNQCPKHSFQSIQNGPRQSRQIHKPVGMTQVLPETCIFLEQHIQAIEIALNKKLKKILVFRQLNPDQQCIIYINSKIYLNDLDNPGPSMRVNSCCFSHQMHYFYCILILGSIEKHKYGFLKAGEP